MPALSVRLPTPLVRQRPWFPGQFGVPGTDADTGLRTHPTGTTFYVDPNFPGASDARDGTDPTSPLLTIAAAIALCQPYRGDTILVGDNSAWFYAEGGMGIATAQYPTVISEEVTVNVAGIRIAAATNGPLGVMWTPASNGGTCITNSAMNTTIEGFVFTEGATFTGCDAIYSEWDGATLFGENLIVRHCTFDDTVDVAIQLEYAWYCLIRDNWFIEQDVQSIYVDPAGSGAAYLNILDNWFHDSAAAMALQGVTDSLIKGNSIYNGNAQAGAVATDEGIDTTGGGDNLIADNYFSCLLPAAANGDWDDLNESAATDAWVYNHCLNGVAVTQPT